MHLKKLINNQLSEKRYEHSLRVAETAVTLAKAHGLNPKKAEIAGLLHDYCKEYPLSEQFRIVVDHGLISSREDLLLPQVLHGPVASWVVAEEDLTHDTEILQAIRYHTTGHPEMDSLAKIVFIADYIEPGRKTPHIDELMPLALKDPDGCVVEIIDRTTRYLLQRRQLIHIDMIRCRNKILMKE